MSMKTGRIIHYFLVSMILTLVTFAAQAFEPFHRTGKPPLFGEPTVDLCSGPEVCALLVVVPSHEDPDLHAGRPVGRERTAEPSGDVRRHAELVPPDDLADDNDPRMDKFRTFFTFAFKPYAGASCLKILKIAT